MATTKCKAQSLPSGDTATYITRPKTKPDVTTRGKLNEWQNGYKEFIPVGSKPSNRTMLKQFGDSSFYKTEGEKQSSYSVHLNCDGSPKDNASNCRSCPRVARAVCFSATVTGFRSGMTAKITS